MKGQLKKGAILSYLNIIISIGTGFISAPLLVKGMGTSEYGAYQMTAALIGYVSVLDFGLHSSVTRYVAKYQAKKEEKAQSNFLGVSLVLFSVIAVLVLFIGFGLYKYVPTIYSQSASAEEVKTIQQLLIVLIINLAVSMPGAVFESIIIAYEKFVFTKFSATIKMLLRFTAIILLGFWNYTAIVVVLIDFILNIIIIVTQILYCFVILHIKVGIHDCSFRYVKSIFTFSIFIFIAGITDQINWKADTTILGITLGTSAVTYYSVAGNLVSYYRNFSSAISGIFLPKAVKMVNYGKSNRELTNLMIRVGRIQFMIIALCLIGFTILGKEFIALWMGAKFTDAYSWFLIMAIPLVVPMTQSIGINIIEAKNMHQFRAVVYFFIALGNIVLTILLVKKFGVLGASVGTGVTMLIGNTFVINWYYSKKVGLEIGRFFREVYLKLAFPIILTLIISFFFNSYVGEAIGWLVFMIKCVGILILYCIIMYVFGLNEYEKYQIFQLRKKGKNE